MHKRDGGLRPLFHSQLRQFHWQAVETGGVGLGVPDSNYCGRGVDGWVEFKQTQGWSVGVRPEQVGWILRRCRAGGRVILVVRRVHDGGPRKGAACDTLYMIRGQEVKRIVEEGLTRQLPLLGFWEGGPGRWDWTAIGRCLVEGWQDT